MQGTIVTTVNWEQNEVQHWKKRFREQRQFSLELEKQASELQESLKLENTIKRDLQNSVKFVSEELGNQKIENQIQLSKLQTVEKTLQHEKQSLKMLIGQRNVLGFELANKKVDCNRLKA